VSVTPIESAGQVDDVMKRDIALIFKHSTRCPISRAAHLAFAAFIEEHPEIRDICYFVDVVGRPPVSRAVAEKTGIRHESPQAIVVKKGRVSWHASHYSITKDALLEAVS